MTKPIDPTPEQIRAMCLEFQAGWTEQERQRRSCYDIQPAEVSQEKTGTRETAKEFN